MSAVETVISVYSLLAGLTFFLGLLLLLCGDRSERRLGARLILTTPGWPIWVLVAIWRGGRYLLKEADLP